MKKFIATTAAVILLAGSASAQKDGKGSAAKPGASKPAGSAQGVLGFDFPVPKDPFGKLTPPATPPKPKIITSSGKKPVPSIPPVATPTGPGWGGGYGVPTKPTQPTGGYGVPTKPTPPTGGYGVPSKPTGGYGVPTKPYPSPSYPTPTPTPSYPAPSHSKPHYPTPSYPAPSYPKPHYPAQTYPAPSYPTPSYPAPVKACYHEQYGKVFGEGYCYPGKAHQHWTFQAHWPKYDCQAYWCPSTTCYYYWCAPAECYYPISYIEQHPPVDVATKDLVGPPAGIPPLPE